MLFFTERERRKPHAFAIIPELCKWPVYFVVYNILYIHYMHIKKSVLDRFHERQRLAVAVAAECAFADDAIAMRRCRYLKEYKRYYIQWHLLKQAVTNFQFDYARVAELFKKRLLCACTGINISRTPSGSSSWYYYLICISPPIVTNYFKWTYNNYYYETNEHLKKYNINYKAKNTRRRNPFMASSYVIINFQSYNLCKIF